MTQITSTTPTALLYLATWLPPTFHQEFSGWCDDHHRDQLSLPGFRRARRFEWVDGGRDDNPPQFLTMYELDSLTTLLSDEYLEHSRTATPLPGLLRGNIRFERRDCTVIAALPSAWWPPTSTSLLEVFQLNDDDLVDGLRDRITQLPQSETSEFSLRLVDSNDNEPLVLIDHDADASEMIATITAASGSLRSSWHCCFDEFPADEFS